MLSGDYPKKILDFQLAVFVTDITVIGIMENNAAWIAVVMIGCASETVLANKVVAESDYFSLITRIMIS